MDSARGGTRYAAQTEKEYHMKAKKILALALAATLLLGLLSGCSKTEASSDDKKPGSSASLIEQTEQSGMNAKYAYQASYVDLNGTEKIQYFNSMCAAGDILYATAYIEGETVTETDEQTGEEYSYTTNESAVFTIDTQTGAYTQLENLQLPQIPEGYEGSVDVYSMSGSADGSLWMLVYLYAYCYELPEDFDPETENEWDYQTDMSTSYLLHISADGTMLANIDLSAASEAAAAEQEDSDGYYSNISSFLVDGQGNLYASDYQTIYVLDAQGTLLFTLDNSERSGSLNAMSSDKIGVMWYNYSDDPTKEDDNGRYFTTIDFEAKDWGEDERMPVNTWSILPGDDAYDFYYTGNSNIYGYSYATGSKEKLVDWLECDVDSNNLWNSVMLSDGRVIGLTQDYSGEWKYQLVILTRVDASELPQKTVLTLACNGLDWDLRSKIVEYNRSSEQYRINVLDYSEYSTDTDYSAGITKLTTEIISGNVPDIFLCNSLPVDKYAARGVIADLYTFIDQDSELNRSYFVPQVLAAMEKDGKLYQLPTSFSVRTAYALSSVVDQYDVWNVAAVQDAMTQLQEGATVFDSGWTKQNVLSLVVGGSIGTFVDWTTGRCEFDSEAFEQLLAFCNTFPEADSDDDGIAYAETAEVEADWGSSDLRIKNGRQLMSNLYLYSFSDYIYSTYSLNGLISFVGFPSEDGKTGSMFDVSTPLAISSVTEHPEAAWEFVRSIIQSVNQDENLYYFPISQAKLNEQATQAMTEELYYDEDGNTVDWDGDGEPDKQAKGGYSYLEGDNYMWQEVYALTQADVDQIMSVIENTSSVYHYDSEIMDIITEEAAYYFAGDKDVRTTASLIQSRVNLYVQEQR